MSPRRAGPLRIVVEPGSYRCQNMGDVAMLQVATTRLARLWPEADIHVFTGDERALAAHCPRATPLSTTGRAHWLSQRAWLPGPAPAPLPQAVRWRDREVGRVRHAALGLAFRLRRRDAGPLDHFVTTLGDADLLVVCGQGSMGDATARHALTVLDTLQLAASVGTPAAMLGQGIGPMADGPLRRRAAAVLPGVGRIGLRERAKGEDLLRRLGVLPERVTVTGDDALELAWQTDTAPGTGLGVNVRISENAGVDAARLPLLTQLLRSEAEDRGVPLVAVPIARGEAGDAAVLRQLFGDGAAEVADLPTPAAVITQVARSRVLVTGAYHAAVFALAQGIPTVCLSDSEYYRWKFEGLRDLFGDGCEIVNLSGQDLAARVSAAVGGLWQRAPDVRVPLRVCAAAQVTRGRQLYQELPGLLDRGHGVPACQAGTGKGGNL